MWLWLAAWAGSLYRFYNLEAPAVQKFDFAAVNSAAPPAIKA
jgi:hypothetical protein